MKFTVSVVALVLLSLLQTPEQIPQLLPESQDVASKEIRAARATIWDFGHPRDALDAPPKPLQPGVPPPPSSPGVIVDLARDLPELPMDTCDIVIVGEVTNVQPFLSKSHTSLYRLGDPLLAGRQYLLFLSKMQSLDAYGVQSMWHVENGVIKAALPNHKANAGRFPSNDGKSLVAVLFFLRSQF
jgi:hypothetical protein